MSAEAINDRMAEAARFAVLNRLMPVLRHDVLGAMQPVRMLLMVLEKRLQNAEPDLQAIRATVASVSTLSKQATAGCVGALGWVAAADDVQVSLHSFINEAIGLLAMELSVNGLTLVNDIKDDSANASHNFLRSVVMGALLAFCDQPGEGGILQVSFNPDNAAPGAGGQLQVRLLADKGEKPALHDVIRKYRLIEWPDVQAMAKSSGVQIARGKGWLTLDLPGS